MSAPLVLLHGFAGTAEDFAPFVSAFRRARGVGSVRALTLPGHGLDPLPPDFDAAVDALAARITDAATPPVHLVGYSLGARLALGVLARHPRLASRATLIGVHPGLADPTERAARLAHDEAWARRLETEGLAAFLDAWEAQPLFDTQRALPVALREAYRARRLRHDPRALAAAMRTLSLGAMPDRAPALPSIRCRVDLVAGALDDKFRALADSIAATLPGARLAIVPGAGHNVLLERPEALGALVAEPPARAPLEALA